MAFADKDTPPEEMAIPSTTNREEDYWHELITESEAAAFYKVSPRTLQRYRVDGGGPVFVRISPRVCRYRRIDLKAHADAKLAHSTAEYTEDAA